MAVVSPDLVEHYDALNLEGLLFAIERFEFNGRGYDDFPRYDGFAIHRAEWTLWINKKTKLSPLDITNEKLTLDEKIIEIESKIVDVFLREYEEQSIHDFLKEKIIEKVLID